MSITETFALLKVSSEKYQAALIRLENAAALKATAAQLAVDFCRKTDILNRHGYVVVLRGRMFKNGECVIAKVGRLFAVTSIYWSEAFSTEVPSHVCNIAQADSIEVRKV